MRHQSSHCPCLEQIWDAQVKSLMQDYDLHLLEDIQGDEDDTLQTPIYCIGDEGDPSVGIQQMEVTPWFPLVKDVVEFVQRHIDRLTLALWSGFERGKWDMLEGFIERYL